jgi:MarR family transcriptional regulator, organic hydroperoxide resistance regulator
VDEQGSATTALETETRPEPGTATPGAPMQPGPDEDLNQQIAEALSGLLKGAQDLAQGIAADLGLTGSDVMALLKLEAPMTMKDLGLKIGCDPSFVTSIADALESHGLARREPSQRDRRSKNIVLTPEGEKARARVCDELFARAPWSTSLDTSERQCLLGLMRKMLRFREGR